jgi:two-component system, NtrC family, sensor kinase
MKPAAALRSRSRFHRQALQPLLRSQRRDMLINQLAFVALMLAALAMMFVPGIADRSLALAILAAGGLGTAWLRGRHSEALTASITGLLTAQDDDRARLALQGAGHFVWELDLTNSQVYLSASWLHTLGYKAEELYTTPQALEAFIHPEDVPAMYTAIARMASGESVRCEYRARHRDGSYQWLLAEGQLSERAPNGRPLRATGTGTNISERKQAEAAADASRKLLTEVIDLLPNYVFWKDSDGVYQGCNAGYAQAVGLMTPSELVGKRDDDLPLPPVAAQSLRAHELAVMAADRPLLDAELPMGLSGRQSSCLVGLIPRHNEHGSVDGVIGMMTDITQLKRAQQERDRERAELAQARKLEAIGQLAAGIAHEINTPMQFISDSIHFVRDALAELSQSSTHSPEREFLEHQIPLALARSIEGVERVTDIVRAMKEMSHPDRAEMVAANLNQALENALVVTRKEYREIADIELHLGSLPEVLCHPGELQQVFMNLIVNAAHAVEEVALRTGTRGLIRLTTRVEGEQVLIEVADSGCGIPASIQDRIFDPFFTTKPVGKGTGQGLSISRSIIERHRGALSVQSTPERGSVFSISLPLTIASPVASPQTQVA